MPSHYKKFKPRNKMKMVIYFLCSKSTEHFMSMEGATDRLPEDGHATCRGEDGGTAQRWLLQEILWWKRRNASGISWELEVDLGNSRTSKVNLSEERERLRMSEREARVQMRNDVWVKAESRTLAKYFVATDVIMIQAMINMDAKTMGETKYQHGLKLSPLSLLANDRAKIP